MKKKMIVILTLLAAFFLAAMVFKPPVTVSALSPIAAEKSKPSLNFQAAFDYSSQYNGLGVIATVNGEIVYEKYNQGYNKDSHAPIHSGTKGFWGPVAALMIQEELLQGYDQKVSDILTEWKGTNKQDITIRQIMELSSGIGNDVQNLQGLTPTAKNLYSHAVNKTFLVAKPGTSFQYGPVNYYVMGAVMQRVLKNSGSIYQTPLEYLNANFLFPMGIHYENWLHDAAGNPHMPNGADISLREWVKWGQFILQKGEWDGKQLVRPDLMEELFKPSITNPGHGLFVWLNKPQGVGGNQKVSAPVGSYAGFMYYNGYDEIIGILGAGPNRLYIVPSLNMVIARQTKISGEGFIDHEFLKLLFEQ